MYSTLTYFLSKVITETVTCTFFGLIFGLIFYWAIGLREGAEHVVMFLFILVILSNSGNYLGLFIGSIFSSSRMGMIASLLFLIPVVLFTGGFKNRDDYSDWIGWI